MTKTNESIHVLADESLGGIKREYVEVDRKAEVGEKIVIVEKADCEEWYKNGDVFTVDREYRPADGDVESDGAASDMNTGGLIYRGEYRVLEPTNIVHIDDPDGTERYEMVDREAEVGEKFIIVNADVQTEAPYSNGNVFTVDESWGVGDVETGCGRLINRREYRVLVPVESSEEQPQPSDPIDVIANLATRVAELERENKRIKEDLGWYEIGPGRIAELRNAVSDIRHDIATLEGKIDHDRAENGEMGDYVYEEMKRMKDEIDTLHKDNRRHGEELARLEKGVNSQAQCHVYRQQEIERVWERMDQIETKTEARKYATEDFIHNELGITKDDFQEMIRIAVTNEVKKAAESGEFQSFISSKIDSHIEEGFGDGGRLLYGFKERVSQTVSNEVGKRIANNLNISVELKSQ